MEFRMSNGIDMPGMDMETVMMEIDPVSLAIRIREARKLAKLTQQQLADACGLTDGTVSAWENGVASSILADNLFAVADACGVDPRWLATGRGPGPRPVSALQEITAGLEDLPIEQQEAVRSLIKFLRR